MCGPNIFTTIFVRWRIPVRSVPLSGVRLASLRDAFLARPIDGRPLKFIPIEGLVKRRKGVQFIDCRTHSIIRYIEHYMVNYICFLFDREY